TLNQLAAEVIAEVGADMSAETPRPIDPALLRRVDRVVVLGNEARVDPAEPMVGTIDTWATDEPSERGIEGIDRMRFVRDDIDAVVPALLTDFSTSERSCDEHPKTCPASSSCRPALGVVRVCPQRRSPPDGRRIPPRVRSRPHRGSLRRVCPRGSTQPDGSRSHGRRGHRYHFGHPKYPDSRSGQSL